MTFVGKFTQKHLPVRRLGHEEVTPQDRQVTQHSLVGLLATRCAMPLSTPVIKGMDLA